MPVQPRISLEVGKTYRSNGGSHFTITKETPTGIFEDDNNNQWEGDGTFLSHYEEGNPFFNLVEMVGEEV